MVDSLSLSRVFTVGNDEVWTRACVVENDERDKQKLWSTYDAVDHTDLIVFSNLTLIMAYLPSDYLQSVPNSLLLFQE